jgi:hypothetical protein
MLAAIIRKSWLLVSITAVWLFGSMYSLNYDIPDISTYFLVFNAVLAVIAFEGFANAVSFLRSRLSNTVLRSGAVTLVVLLTAISGVALNHKEADQSHNRFATDLAKEILRTLPDSALVFQGLWDIQSSIIYLQQVERYRPDIVMLDMNLMQRSWYIKQQQLAHPQVFSGCEKEITDFLREVKSFESGSRFDGTQIEVAYVALHNKIIKQQLPLRPVYLRYAREVGHPNVGAGFKVYPGTFFLRLEEEPISDPVMSADSITQGRREFDARESYLINEVAAFSALQGSYAISRGDTQTVREALSAASLLAPEITAVQNYTRQAIGFLGGEKRAE